MISCLQNYLKQTLVAMTFSWLIVLLTRLIAWDPLSNHSDKFYDTASGIKPSYLRVKQVYWHHSICFRISCFHWLCHKATPWISFLSESRVCPDIQIREQKTSNSAKIRTHVPECRPICYNLHCYLPTRPGCQKHLFCYWIVNIFFSSSFFPIFIWPLKLFLHRYLREEQNEICRQSFRRQPIHQK